MRAGELMREDEPGEIASGTVELRDGIARVDPHWGENVERFSSLSPEERDKVLKTAVYSDVPYAVFFMRAGRLPEVHSPNYTVRLYSIC